MRRILGPRDGDADLDRWVAAARDGDSDAFGRIWQSLSGRVAGYLRGRGVDSPDDVTSEVFLAAFSGLSGFTGDGARFRSWLFTIAHHKAVDELRRRRVDEEYDAATDPRTSPSAELDVLASTLDHDVRAALAALTDEQREVLLLRTLGDLSVEQVAALTGRSVGAVKQLHHRAVASAQRALAARERGVPGTAYPHMRPVVLPEPDPDGRAPSHGHLPTVTVPADLGGPGWSSPAGRPSVVMPAPASGDASWPLAGGRPSVVLPEPDGAGGPSETHDAQAVTSTAPAAMTES